MGRRSDATFGMCTHPMTMPKEHCFGRKSKLIIVDSGVPWVLCGDFNVVRGADQKIGASFHQAAMDVFLSFIDALGLIDLPLKGGRFTWCSNREISHPLQGWTDF